VEHRIRWHVVRGPLKSIDLVSVNPSAMVDADVVITTDDGRALTGHAIRRDERTVRVTIDEPRAVMRGNFTFDVRWHMDLVASRSLTRDGATWRLGWSAPVATDGYDAAKTVFEVPAAPDAPVAIVADTGAVDDAVVASLRRDPGTDVLELVRPHVARGEAPVWTLRVDPRALALVADPTLRPPSEAKPPPEPDRVRDASAAAGLAALALAFGLLVHRKTRTFASACTARGATARALLPLPDGARATLAGVALAAGVWFETTGQAMAGAACVAVATMAAGLRAPEGKVAARGPGRWLAMKPDDVFAADTSSGAAWLLAPLAAVAVVVAAALVAQRFDAEGPWLVALDAIALAPLLLTGNASQLPPDGARSAAPWLRRAYAALRRVASLRVTPWARVPVDADRPDELRVLVLPRVAMPGVVGVEIGLAWSHTPAGWAPTPEVLARVLDGSAAAARLARELPAARSVPGRRPEERVVRLSPRAPSRRHAVALARALADSLTDRRSEVKEVKTWAGADRRLPALAPAGQPG
jgi:hypothetical protein